MSDERQPRTGRPKVPRDHEAAAVRWAREAAGLTQAQLAEMLGVSTSLICQIETNARNATPVMISRLARVLGCPRVALERKREPETNGKAA